MKALYNGQLLFGPRGPAGPDGNPIGTIISYMGLAAPKDYLICNGAVYNISDYFELSQFFQQQFGSANYFGGDGETTFAVPDMRNLFLRGYHGEAEEQLSDDVGVKQEATNNVTVLITDFGHFQGAVETEVTNADSRSPQKTRTYVNPTGKDSTLAESTYTSRPVNMAVLYCIKATVAEPAENIYSTEETLIGQWIDGKPLYRRVFLSASPAINLVFDTPLSEIDYFNACRKYCRRNKDGRYLEPYYFSPTDYCTILAQKNIDNTVSCIARTSFGDISNLIIIFEYTKTTDQATIELPAMLAARPVAVAAAASAASVKFETSRLLD